MDILNEVEKFLPENIVEQEEKKVYDIEDGEIYTEEDAEDLKSQGIWNEDGVEVITPDGSKELSEEEFAELMENDEEFAEFMRNSILEQMQAQSKKGSKRTVSKNISSKRKIKRNQAKKSRRNNRRK